MHGTSQDVVLFAQCEVAILKGGIYKIQLIRLQEKRTNFAMCISGGMTSRAESDVTAPSV